MLRARNFCLYKIINRYFPKNWPSFFLLKKPSSCGILVDKNKSKLPSLFMNLALHDAPHHDGLKELLQGDHHCSDLLRLPFVTFFMSTCGTSSANLYGHSLRRTPDIFFDNVEVKSFSSVKKWDKFM